MSSNDVVKLQFTISPEVPLEYPVLENASPLLDEKPSEEPVSTVDNDDNDPLFVKASFRVLASVKGNLRGGQDGKDHFVL